MVVVVVVVVVVVLVVVLVLVVVVVVVGSDTISQGGDRVTHGGQTSSTMPSLPRQWSVRCILSNAVHTTSNSKPSLQQIVQGGHQGCTPGFTMKNLFFLLPKTSAWITGVSFGVIGGCFGDIGGV